MVKSQLLDRTFSALSDPTRREILQRLSSGPATISELAQPFRMSLPGFMKHVRVLEGAHLVTTAKRGRTRECRLGSDRLEDATEWIEEYRGRSLGLHPRPGVRHRISRLRQASMAERRDSQFEALLADAQQDPDVLGLFLFGSRSREGFADERSDYDVGVVLADREGALAAFDERWPYAHGATLEIASTTMSGLREHGEYDSPTEWARYQYSHVALLIDKSGDVQTVLRGKERVPDAVRAKVVEDALGGYVNSTYRSLRNRMVGVEQGARLDAGESLPHVLTAIFAIESRVRPFNKYLEWELRMHPLADRAWAADILLPRLDAVLAAEADGQHALFRDVERVARRHEFGSAIDEWKPDLEWLRGEAAYRG